MMTVEPKGIRSSQVLLDAGWKRRFLAAPDRTQEAVETYTQMGFEVHVQTLTPADFEAGCGTCRSSVCSSYVLIYTRKNPDGPGDDR